MWDKLIALIGSGRDAALAAVMSGVECFVLDGLNGGAVVILFFVNLLIVRVVLYFMLR